LLNLAVNARDAMPEGGKIVIAARQEHLAQARDGLEPGDYVCVSVVDRGEGMSEETLTRAMEPFFTTKGIGKGTGLGLSMVQGFAQQCGGALLLKSKPGEGTTAEIWLRTSAEVEPKPLDPAADILPDIGRLRILAVDDDALVLTNTAEMLEELGHEVFQAGSGAQALRVLAEQPGFDIVLTDYAMPAMTGAQLADAIEKDRPGLPVLMVSGYAELPPGAVAHLPKLAKPFREDELARALADATAKRRAES
jgi:CheY-like chemotaxis protein